MEIKRGMKGIVLEPGLLAQPMHLDDPRIYPVYAHLEDRGIPVLFMAGGNAGPDITYTAPEHIDRVARDFPQMKIISGHGNWPWVAQIIHICYRRTNIWLSPDMYLFGGMPGAREYVDVMNGFMSERFLFATAYPVLPLGESVEKFLPVPAQGIGDRPHPLPQRGGPARSRVVPYAGKIHYEVIDLAAPWERTGETIIFHHGIGASAGIWQEWLPELIDRYRIVRLDMRGYGRSHIPAPGDKWSPEVFVEDLLAVADAVGPQRPHLVGESIGGTIALYFTLRHRDRVATLTISNGADRGAPLQKVNEWQEQLDRHGVKQDLN